MQRAIVFQEQTITGEAFHERIRSSARVLQAAGVGEAALPAPKAFARA